MSQVPEAALGSLCVCAQSLQSCLTLGNTIDCSPLGSLSMGFSRQKYWSGLLCPPARDLPDPGIKRVSPTLQMDSLPTELPGKLGEVQNTP